MMPFSPIMITLSAFQGIFIKDRIFGIKHIMIAKLAIRRISPHPEKTPKIDTILFYYDSGNGE